MTGVALTTWAEVRAFAAEAAKSEMVPKAYRGKPADIALAIQLGSEIGLGPMQSLQNIAVIGGRPSIYGDAMLALCRRDRRCLRVTETIEGEGEARTATCVVERAAPDGVVERVASTFSVADAMRARLWDERETVRRKSQNGGTWEAPNDSPWHSYPDRMLQMRARGFALRDAFPDLLRGLISAEEAGDIPVREQRRQAPSPLPPSEAEAVGQRGADTEDQGERGPSIVHTTLADTEPYVIYGRDGRRDYASGPEWLGAWKRLLSSVVERHLASPEDGERLLGSAQALNAGAIERVREIDPELADEVLALMRIAGQQFAAARAPVGSAEE